MSLYSVILCGGRGERFWPKSRRSLPKQFIALFGDESLTALTSRRMARLSPMARQLFVAPAEFGPLLRRQLKLRKRNLLFEPYGRNTAPAIGIAAAYLHRLDPDATMAVLPADHLIRRQRDYESSMRLAARLAQDGTLVTFGIPEGGELFLEQRDVRVARGRNP
jgi:mannose-1-phosphate guanylyltransferase